MEKYEQHGLSRAQDDILGGFGLAEEEAQDTLRNDSITPEQREAVKQLVQKGLLESHMRDDFSVEFRLTPKGKRLWNVRNEEEAEPRP